MAEDSCAPYDGGAVADGDVTPVAPVETSISADEDILSDADARRQKGTASDSSGEASQPRSSPNNASICFCSVQG